MGQEGSLPVRASEEGDSQGSQHGHPGHLQGIHGGAGSAEQAMRLLAAHYQPTSTSIVKATENAPALGVRDLAISATMSNLNPEYVQWNMIQGAIRRGFVDRIRIQFDAMDYSTFIPQLMRTFSYCDKIQSLELFSDQMPKIRLLPMYAYPNCLESLPKSMPALSSFHLACTLGQLLHFDVVAMVMMRAPNLKAVRLEGMRLAATNNKFAQYIPCKLHTLILIRCEFPTLLFDEVLCRSGRSLRTFHIEHVTGPARDQLAQIISGKLPDLLKLTVILPEALALSGGILELHELLDVACVQPLLSVFELYAAGMACTDLFMLRATNNIGQLKTQLPQLTKLTLHNCSRVKMSSLVIAIRTGRFPRLSWLEAIWDAKDFETNDLLMLYKACADARITLSEAMSAAYSWLNTTLSVEEAVLENKGKAKRVLEEELKNVVARVGTPGAALPGSPYSATSSSVSGSSSRRSHCSRRSSRKKKDKHRRHGHSKRDESSSEDSSDGTTTTSNSTEDSSSQESSSEESSHGGRHHHGQGQHKRKSRSSKSHSSRK